MSRVLLALCLCLSSLLAGVPAERRTVRFVALDVLVDAGPHRLAAWQLEVVADGAVLVGVEGGDAAAFRDAPRYDPAALHRGRVVLAALADGEPRDRGELRVARLHYMVTAEGRAGEYALRGVVAGNAAGERIEVAAEVRPLGENR